MKVLFLPAARAGVLADSINDADSTRKVYLLAAGLAVLGIVLIVMTVLFWRNTRHDPELLAPLETMGSRRFRKLDDGSKRQLLDAVRPADAKPMRWGVVRGSATAEPEVDLGAIRHAAVSDYNDLRDPVQPSASASADPVPFVSAVAAEREVVVDVVPDVDAGADGPEAASAADESAQAETQDDDDDVVAAEVPPSPRAADDGDESLAGMQDDPLLRPILEPERPRFKPDPRAFVVTPLDHDMPLIADDEPADDAPVAAQDDDDTAVGQRAAIDPLLRRLEHTD